MAAAGRYLGNGWSESKKELYLGSLGYKWIYYTLPMLPKSHLTCEDHVKVMYMKMGSIKGDTSKNMWENVELLL